MVACSTDTTGGSNRDDESGHLRADYWIRRKAGLCREAKTLEPRISEQQRDGSFALRAQPIELERRDQYNRVAVSDDISFRFDGHYRCGPNEADPEPWVHPQPSVPALVLYTDNVGHFPRERAPDTGFRMSGLGVRRKRQTRCGRRHSPVLALIKAPSYGHRLSEWFSAGCGLVTRQRHDCFRFLCAVFCTRV